MRGGDGADPLIERRLYRVLVRHGYYRSELERVGVPPLEAGNQLRFCMSPEQLLVEGDERIRSPLRGKDEPIERRNEIASGGPNWTAGSTIFEMWLGSL